MNAPHGATGELRQMLNVTKLPQPQRLEMLARLVHQHHCELLAGVRCTVKAAMALGDVLTTAREEVGHGGWLEWLRSTPIQERSARRYMQLARERDVLEAKLQAGEVNTIEEALEALRPVDAEGSNRSALTGEVGESPPAVVEGIPLAAIEQIVAAAIAAKAKAASPRQPRAPALPKPNPRTLRPEAVANKIADEQKQPTRLRQIARVLFDIAEAADGRSAHEFFKRREYRTRYRASKRKKGKRK
jgi:hypothetical protein